MAIPLCVLALLPAAQVHVDRAPPTLLEEVEGIEASDPQSQQGEQRRMSPPSESLEDRDRNLLRQVLLDWGGLRSRLEDIGLEIEFLAAADVSHAAAGGADPGGTVLRALFDLAVTFRTEPTLGYEGGTFFADVQALVGEDASLRFGVLQAFSNIDTSVEGVHLARIWYEQEFGSTGTLVRAGKIDANTLFAYVDGGSGFLHSSMGFSPTILGLPTFPDPAFGLAAQQRLGQHLQVRAGVFDGAAQEGYSTGSLGPATLFGSPDDLFYIGELEAGWTGGRAGLGAWAHTGRFARFDGGEEDGTHGLYAVFDQRLAGGTGPAADPHGMDTFLQLGVADPDVSDFTLHLGTGLAWRHPFAPSSNDELGLGLSLVELSDAEGADLDGEREVAFELFYGFEPIPWVRLQPDVQYIVNPGGDASLDDALLLTLRLAASL